MSAQSVTGGKGASVRVASIFGGVAIVGDLHSERVSATRLSGAEQLAIFAAIMLVAAGFMLRGRQADADRAPRRPRLPFVFTAIQGLVVGSLTGLAEWAEAFDRARPGVGRALHARCRRHGVARHRDELCGGILRVLGQAKVAWLSVALVTAGAMPGIATGTYAMRFVSEQALRRGFAVLLIGVAVYMLRSI